VLVTNNGVNSNFFPVFRSKLSPTLFTLDVTGHVVARHLDASLVGPTTLYSGLTTPAKPGETISVVGSGFGLPTNGPLVAGSAIQSGPLGSAGLGCIIGSQRATTVGAWSGLDYISSTSQFP
jgi:uncharacterized protein (TIGR03437 family)